MSAFGALLTTYRSRAHLSQRELALRAGTDPSFISYLTSGHRQPTRETVGLLATALHLALRERDTLLIAAGYAPDWLATCLDDPQLLYRLWAEVQYRDRLEVAV